MFIRYILFAAFFWSIVAKASEDFHYEQIIILAGDKHRLQAFSPLLEGLTSETPKIEFYGMNVNPNRGDHLKDLSKYAF